MLISFHKTFRLRKESNGMLQLFQFSLYEYCGEREPLVKSYARSIDFYVESTIKQGLSQFCLKTLGL